MVKKVTIWLRGKWVRKTVHYDKYGAYALYRTKTGKLRKYRRLGR